jgi:hypothetical protein
MDPASLRGLGSHRRCHRRLRRIERLRHHGRGVAEMPHLVGQAVLQIVVSSHESRLRVVD